MPTFRSYRFHKFLASPKAVLLTLLLLVVVTLPTTRWIIQRTHASSNPPITFSFTLDSSYTTSAGAFTPDGTLVRTLWSRVKYSPGVHTATWDGNDDNGSPVAAGSYQIRVLYDNVQYVWDGTVGNTSSAFSGSAVFHNATPLDALGNLAINGTNAFWTVGYAESGSGVKEFSLNDPETSMDAAPRHTPDMWTQVAADGSKYYVADSSNGYDSFSSSFVTAFSIGSNNEVPFSSGTDIVMSGPFNDAFPGAIDVAQKSTDPGTAAFDQAYVTLHAATGIAVQTSGSILAVAHGPLNTVRLFNKTTGASDGAISVTAPGSVAFDANGDLWVISGTSAYRYTSLGTTPTLATTISGLTDPLSIAAHPSDANVVLIADGGASQQIKAFDSTGSSLWTYGLAGGYATNGTTVANNIFQFGPQVPLAIQSDGSFWIGDGGTNRFIHYTASRTYVEQILFHFGGYASAVDENNPNRVFIDYSEYSVDYSKPLQPGDPQALGGNAAWNLVKDWGENLPSKYIEPGSDGFTFVATLSNNRTYGLVGNWNDGNFEIMELAAGGLRDTGIEIPKDSSLYGDGSIRYAVTAGSTQTLYIENLTGFDGSGNPQYAAPVVFATYPGDVTKDPSEALFQIEGRSGPRFPTTSTGITVSTNTTSTYVSGSNVDAGMHLGGFKQGATDWLWKSSPAVTTDIPLDGKGSYDIGDGITYAAANVMASGRNVVYAFNGEFYNGSEANQLINYYDDGLFVGQFGTPGDVEAATGNDSVAGAGGNELSTAMVTASNGETYIYTTDEAQHGGLQRWHMVGAKNIREMTASGSLGSTLTLVAPAATFPPALEAKPGNTEATLDWQPVPNATSYTVKDATNPGGPYTTVASGVTGTSYQVTSLTNSTAYYFVVSDTVSGIESNNSDEATARPINPATLVGSAGKMVINPSGYDTYNLTSTDHFPLMLQTYASTLGTMEQNQLGSDGYVVYDFAGDGSPLSHLPSGTSIALGTGWTGNDGYAHGHFIVDGVQDENGDPLYGSFFNQTVSGASGGTGTITVNPGDAAWHYLTLYSPSSNDTNEADTVTVQSQTNPSDTASQSVNDDIAVVGYTGMQHFFQFLIKGPVTVSIISNNAGAPEIKAVFLDNVETAQPIAPVCLQVTPSTLKAGLQDLSGIEVDLLNGSGGIIDSRTGLTSDHNGLIGTDAAFQAEIASASSIRVKAPGFLGRVNTIPGSIPGCINITNTLTVGDFTNTNQVNLQDLVLGIQAYNGSPNAAVQAAYKRSVGLVDLVGLIHTYNTSPVGQ